MNKNWTEIHSKIFTEICDSLNKNNIRYFILRNYKDYKRIFPYFSNLILNQFHL